MPRYQWDELIQKDKSELEKIKLALDVYQSEDKYAFERKKFRTENIRFITIALLTAGISLGSSYVIESFKQKSAAKENVKKDFNDLRKTYLQATSKAKEKDIACAITRFDNSYQDESIIIEQQTYIKICNSDLAIQNDALVINNTDTSSLSTQEAIKRLGDYEKQLQALKQQKKVVTPPEQLKINNEIKSLSQSIDSVVASTPQIKAAVTSTVNIQKNVEQIDKADNEIKKNAGPDINSKRSETLWFKTGYFLQFGDYRVLLESLDKRSGIQVQICKTTSSAPCSDPLLKSAWVKYGTPLQFSDGGKSFRINLVDIDHAGNNPFKLAAFVNFESFGN